MEEGEIYGAKQCLARVTPCDAPVTTVDTKVAEHVQRLPVHGDHPVTQAVTVSPLAKNSGGPHKLE